MRGLRISNQYVDLKQTFMDFKLKLVKNCGFETFNTKEDKNQHKVETKEAAVGLELLEEISASLITYASTILQSISANVVINLNNQQFYYSIVIHFYESYNSHNFKEPTFEIKGASVCDICDYKEHFNENADALFVDHFFHKENEIA